MSTEQWSKAEECGRELMKSDYGYGLMDNYADIFTLENEGNKEIISLVLNKEVSACSYGMTMHYQVTSRCRILLFNVGMVIKYLGRFTIHLRMETIV